MIRSLERKRSAALRAISGDPTAELRGHRMVGAGGVAPLNSPFLTLAGHDDLATGRGLADALGLAMRHSDTATHLALRPGDAIERAIFDLLEQLRCLSLAPDLPGVRRNITVVIDAWCRHARAHGVGESGVGLLIYTLAHMARARLGLGFPDEEVDAIIEGARSRLGRLVGHALRDLRETASDQVAFAVPAREIARLVAEMAADTTAAGTDNEDPARYRMIVPPEWLDVSTDPDANSIADAFLSDLDDREDLEQLGGYRVFTQAHDVTLLGTELHRAEVLARARVELDETIRNQSISAQRLALRLRRIFSTPTDVGWEYDQPRGRIDARRLPQLVTTVDPTSLFRRPQPVRTNTTAVALLLDNSGSMKAHRFETLAVLADTMSRALDLAGVTHEILGHTTASWSGGQSFDDWKSAGRPEAPGRVADLARIIYKSADQPWRRARRSLAAMRVTGHFRESIDGEAVIWAHERLLARPEPRKILIVVSDGAPAESGTAMANDQPFLLAEHFAMVVRRIEQRSPVEIAAFSIGGNVDSVFASSVAVDLDTTPSVADYAALERLFT